MPAPAPARTTSLRGGTDHGDSILVARVGDTRCGIAVEAIRHITRAVAVTPLPSAPRGVRGILDYRGQVIPVVDLRDRLGLPQRPDAMDDHLIVANTGRRLCAFHVDEAIGVADVDRGDVVAARSVVAGTRLVAGVARTADGLVLLQDLSAMLSQAEEEQLDSSLSKVPADAFDD